MDAKKIAKNTGKGAGIVAMAFLAGMAATAQAQADAQAAQQRRRPFSPRFSDEFDTKTLVITSGDETLSLQRHEGCSDSCFVIVDSTLKGCKPGRVVEFKSDRVTRDIDTALTRDVYLSDSSVTQAVYYLSGSYEPLLFSRENKDGEMVPTFMDKGWKAELLVEAAN